MTGHTPVGDTDTAVPPRGRRYVAVVQDSRGYPAPGAALDPAPPEGPERPVVHSVVLASEYDELRDALTTIYARLGTSSTIKKDAAACVAIARKALYGEDD